MLMVAFGQKILVMEVSMFSSPPVVPGLVCPPKVVMLYVGVGSPKLFKCFSTADRSTLMLPMDDHARMPIVLFSP